jgi:hypothetical protein
MTKPGITGLGLYGYGFLVPQSPYLAECRSLAGKIRWLQQLFDQEGDRYHAQRHPALFSADTEESRHCLQAAWWLGMTIVEG